jgi:hypothetical protein
VDFLHYAPWREIGRPIFDTVRRASWDHSLRGGLLEEFDASLVLCTPLKAAWSKRVTTIKRDVHSDRQVDWILNFNAGTGARQVANDAIQH